MWAPRKEFIDHWQRMQENHPDTFAHLQKKEYQNHHIEWWSLPPKSMALVNSSTSHLLKNFDYDIVHPNKMTRREWLYEHITLCSGTAEYIDELMSQCWYFMSHVNWMQELYSLQEIYRSLLEIKNNYTLEIKVREAYIQKNPNKDPYIPKQRISNWNNKHESNLKKIQQISKTLTNRLHSNQDEWY